jgi:hypothetical protein
MELNAKTRSMTALNKGRGVNKSSFSHKSKRQQACWPLALGQAGVKAPQQIALT